MENDTNVTGEVTEKQETEQKTFTQDELNAIVSDRVKRANEKYADYEDLKKKLALRYPNDRKTYTLMKSNMIKEILGIS